MTLDGLNTNKNNEQQDVSNTGPRRTPYIDGTSPEGRAKPIQRENMKEISVKSHPGINAVNQGSEVREISSYDIAPPAPQNAINEDFLNDIMGSLDMAVEREKEKITKLQDNLIQSGIDEIEEAKTNAAIVKDDDEAYYETEADADDNRYYEDTRNTNISYSNNISNDEENKFEEEHETAKVVTISRSIEDDLADEVEEDNDSEEEYNEAIGNKEQDTKNALEDLKKEVKGIVTPIKQKLDLTKFTIVNKAKSVQDVLRMVTSDIKTAEWVLPYGKTCESFTPLSALDIINLDPQNHTKSRLNTFRQIYKIMYDHIVTPGKPDFEKWLRVTLFHDIDNIYFGLYLATFRDSAFINLSCEKRTPENKNAKGCGHQFIEEHNPMDYVKFANDDEKKKFEKIMNSDKITDDSYNVTLVQISDDYAVGLRMPSIYNVILETASLTQEFLNNHSHLLEVFSYIDSIYYIDKESSNLVPIEYKVDKKNAIKTTVNKIRAYNSIYATFTADQQAELLRNIHEIENEYNIDYKFIIPEATCPKCGEKVAETDITAQYLLFTRHQLGRLTSM